MLDTECARCDGTGWIEAGQWPCPECDGKGIVFIPPRFCMAKDDEQFGEPDCDYPNCYCAN